MIGEILTGVGALASGIGAIGSIYQGKKNFELQQKNYDYQQALQQQVFNREDTSITRRMQDAANAGLNPYSVMSLGGAGSGNVVQTKAPQSEVNWNGVLDMVNSVMSLKQNYYNTEAKKEEANNAAKEGLILDADLVGKLNTNKILGYEADMANLNYNKAWMSGQRDLADFNFDFGTKFFMDEDNVLRHRGDPVRMFGNSFNDTKYVFDRNNKSDKAYWDFLSSYYNANIDMKRDLTFMEDWQKDNEYRGIRNFVLPYSTVNQTYNSFGSLASTLSMVRLRKEMENLYRKENQWYNVNQGLKFSNTLIDYLDSLLQFNGY